MKNDNPNHQLRFSIDLKTLKQHEFTAQLSLRYPAIPQIGLTAFRSASIGVPNPRVETTLKDCFFSGHFQASTGDIASKLSRKLLVELWHCDRLKKDILLGVATVDLQKILEMPLRTTTQSYARVLDVFVPVDEVDDKNKPIKTIGSLRVISYLQDLGPADQFQKKGFNIRQFLEEVPEQPNLPSQNEDYQTNVLESAGLNQLERKVVWQLQTWKKAEQTKTRITLKQKEIDFWTNLSEQQRKSDVQKEKQFKKIEANIILQQGKIKAKANELAKRQQKIILFEQELQTKIAEVSRECLLKDQEIEAIKRRAKEDKNAVIKQKTNVEIEVAKLRAQNAKLKVQIQQLKKQDEKSPLNILKSQLNSKNLEIKQLSREVQKANEVKQEYKIYYGKMKEEVITLRQKLRYAEEAAHELKRQKDIVTNNCRHLEQQLAYERQMYQQHLQRGINIRSEDWKEEEDIDDAHLSQKELLIRQRERLIRENNYTANDPLILELDRQIRAL